MDQLSAKTKEIAAGFEDRSPAHRRIWQLFENKSNKSEAAVIREMKKVFLHIPRPERVEFMLALLPKLVCAPTKVIRKPTSPLVVLLDDVDPNAVSSEQSVTALLYLAECSAGDLNSMENQVVLGQQLLDAGANVNKRAGAQRLYPLHTALHSENVTNLDYRGRRLHSQDVHSLHRPTVNVAQCLVVRLQCRPWGVVGLFCQVPVKATRKTSERRIHNNPMAPDDS